MAIEAQGLEIQIGARTLLPPTDFHVAKGDKIGLVGRNGAGKTTLTRVITGDMLSNSGKVSVSGADGHITVTLDKAAGISVYTTSGTAVASTEGKAGTNEISLPCGMYIVKAAGTVTKVIVR